MEDDNYALMIEICDAVSRTLSTSKNGKIDWADVSSTLKKGKDKISQQELMRLWEEFSYKMTGKRKNKGDSKVLISDLKHNNYSKVYDNGSNEKDKKKKHQKMNSSFKDPTQVSNVERNYPLLSHIPFIGKTTSELKEEDVIDSGELGLTYTAACSNASHANTIVPLKFKATSKKTYIKKSDR